MKKQLFPRLFAWLSLTLLIGCNDNDTMPVKSTTAPSPEAFNAVQDAALENITQQFQITANSGDVNLMSEKGVSIYINSNHLTLNGVPVTGTVDLKFIEIFDSALMAATNKATMGRKLNGDLAMLLSGGEFYINAYKNGQALEIARPMRLIVPTVLTGGVNNEMRLWNAVARDTIGLGRNLVWDPVNINAQDNGLGIENDNYYAYFNNFGWTNVDCFYNDPRQKTTILVAPPAGYNADNSTVYLSYDGRGNALAQLNVFTDEGYFSEHYGQIPIGLPCHVIFVSASGNQFTYAIKPVTIVANQVISFSNDALLTGSEADFIAAVRAIQE